MMIINNEYFDGKVNLLGYETSNGKATIGVMAPGNYEFGTDVSERMTVIQGCFQVFLRGKSDFVSYYNGQSFVVESQSTFSIIIEENTSYLCEFLK